MRTGRQPIRSSPEGGVDVFHPQLELHEVGGRTWSMLVWRSDANLCTISSAPSGGGLGMRSWVINAQVPLSYARCDPQTHIEELAASIKLAGSGVGMLTAASLRDVRFARDSDATGVEVAATVGLRVPTWAAASTPAGNDVESTGIGDHVGTINIVAFIPQTLSDAAMVNAVGTATEAKAQALWDAGVAGTGTATDAICICCPGQAPAAAFGGPRSFWGARLAQAVHAGVLAGARSWGRS